MKTKLIAISLLISSMCIFSTVLTADAPIGPRPPITLSGYIYQNGVGVSEIDVYAKNLETGKIIKNAINVSSSGRYKISLEKIQGTLTGNDRILVYAYRTVNNYTYYAENMFYIAYDIVSTGGSIQKNIVFPQTGAENGNGGTTPLPPPAEGRTRDPFRVYGQVTTSEGKPANSSTVIIKNIMTGDEKMLKTNAGGNYSWNIGQLENGWKINDRIVVNATYEHGEKKEYGKAPSFYIFGRMIDKKVNIKMFVIEETIEDPEKGLPKTYDGLLTEYYLLWNSLNATKTKNIEYEFKIYLLSNTIEEMENNMYTKEETDNMISKALENYETDGGDNMLTILLLVSTVLLILYVLYEKNRIPFIKKKNNIEKVKEFKEFKTIPIIKKNAGGGNYRN